jgi:hypothetical protein
MRWWQAHTSHLVLIEKLSRETESFEAGIG